MKGLKLDPPGVTTLEFKGVHFLTPFSNTGDPKLDPQQIESGACLEVRFLPPEHLLQLRCSNVEMHQRHANQLRVDNEGLEST